MSLNKPQPQVTRHFEASLSDPDGSASDERWQWARSDDGETWTDIEGATSPTRNPVVADLGSYLRATVMYADIFGGGKSEFAVSENRVEARTLANAAPSFADQDEDTTAAGVQVTRSMNEETAEGVSVGKLVSATDADGDDLLYSLEDGGEDADNDGIVDAHADDDRDTSTPEARDGDSTRFTIDGRTGQLKAKVKLSFEADAGAANNCVAKNACELTVKATDPSGAPKSVQVSVSVKDVNEAPKFPTGAPTTLTVEENDTEKDLLKPDGDDPGTDPDDLGDSDYAATDQDSTLDDTTEYALEGADKAKFSISTAGLLTVATDHDPDYEKQSSYSIVIVVTSSDENGPARGKLSARLAVTVNVSDQEDTGTVKLSQRQSQVDRPTFATLTDPDGGEVISKWEWAVVDCDTETFGTAITGASSASYSPKTAENDMCLQARATYEDNQGTDPEMAHVTSDGPVQMSDPANSAPKFPDQNPSTVVDESDETVREVAENTKSGVNIGGPVTADDAGELLMYSLGGPDGASFGIEFRTGQIKTKAALDYEALPDDAKYYMVTVTATDPSGASDSIMVTINVTNVNDGATITLGPGTPPEPENTAPAFDGSSATRMVAENAAAGAYVGDPVTAMDADDDSLTYSLSGSMYFNVNDDGQIMTTAMLDHEAMMSHTVTVTASDGEAMDSIMVTIMVGNMYPDCATQGGDAANMYLNNDCEALLDSKDALGGSLNWDEAMPINDWDGIRGRAGALAGSPMRVTWLYLHGQHGGNLDGSIPAALGRLSALERLYLHRNNLTGEIPGELSELTNLVWLRLYNNDLSGEIPDLTGMDSLERLYIHENDLSGGIPATLGNLSSLTHMLLQRNELSGEIPAMLGDMSTLVWLGLYDNMLMGGIPMELGSLSNLERLYLHGNMLSGEVPMEIGNLSALTNLWLNNNSGLSGQLPMSLDTLANLERVRISGTGFTGCIPAAVAAVENSDAAMLNLPTCQ